MIIGKWNKSVILTYFGMISALAGIFLAFTQENINYPMACLMAAGVCDLFDGTVARMCKRTEEEKAFGIELDSLINKSDCDAFIDLDLYPVWSYQTGGKAYTYSPTVTVRYSTERRK